jgi:hypothetical protein
VAIVDSVKPVPRKETFIDESKLNEVRDHVADWDDPFKEEHVACPIINLFLEMNYNSINKKGDS